MWKSKFGRPTPSTRCSCVCLTHWLISTQLKKSIEGLKKARATQKLKREGMTARQKRDYANKQSKAQRGGLSPDQDTQFVKLVKVNSRRESSRCILVELVATPSTRRASETRSTHPSFPCAGTRSM